jgi:predicted transcriptional regulator
MYEMRRQGMTNAEIAKQLGVTSQTVYNHIGGQRVNAKNTETKKNTPVVNTANVSNTDTERPSEPVAVFADKAHAPTAEKPPFRCMSIITSEEKAKKNCLVLEGAQYNMKGEVARYLIDTSDETVEFLSGDIVSGVLDKAALGRFIVELEQVKSILDEGKVSA